MARRWQRPGTALKPIGQLNYYRQSSLFLISSKARKSQNLPGFFVSFSRQTLAKVTPYLWSPLLIL